MSRTRRGPAPSTVLKYNPNQLREPAGTPIGGRFASSGRGSRSGSLAIAKHQFDALKGRWASVNNELLELMDKPDSPEVKAKMQELKDISKQIHRLNLDPGGREGVGMPGGPRDIVIVGAGPGGLAAAVMGGTDGLDTLVIDAQERAGGQAKFSSRIENYPGFSVGTSGEKLANSLVDQAERVGAQTKLGVQVTGIEFDPETGLKTLTLSNGEKVVSRTVIIATGIKSRTMNFPGSDHMVSDDGRALAVKTGKGTAVVIGGSNGAAQAALGVARSAEHVTVLARSAITKSMSDYQVTALRNHPRITVIEEDEIVGYDPVSSTVSTKNGMTVKASAVGAFIGGGPNTSWVPDGIKKDKTGRIEVNTGLETSMPGVFAVGDARSGSIGRIGAAVGDGQFAAKGVWDYFDRYPTPKGAN